ncbi:hypothetical protein [Bacillus sp. CGMCC 1.16541]|uniref:hypothetical protein n=1 Tax=Bacillus sp. CGMCC 1.16541 TaxID=2185143 RepID=UPI000D737D43|nr:hypothetical protein [Bacillus sp. CGMCC 1.16541]
MIREAFYKGYDHVNPLNEEVALRYHVCAGLEYLAGLPYFSGSQPNPTMFQQFYRELEKWLEGTYPLSFFQK